MSTASVNRKLKSLQEKGFIERDYKGMKNVTTTRVIEPEVENAIRESRPDIYKRLRPYEESSKS